MRDGNPLGCGFVGVVRSFSFLFLGGAVIRKEFGGVWHEFDL